MGAATLVGCASLTGSDPISQRREAQRIVARLADPAMEGRGAGTQGLERARDFLIKRFRAIGLEPAFKDRPHAYQRTYGQTLDIALAPKVVRQTLGVWGGQGGEVVKAEGGQDFNALGFSGGGAFEGPLAFVGYGIVEPQHGYDSYGGLGPEGLEGAVAVVFRYEPQDENANSRWGRVDGHGGRLGRWSSAASLIKKATWAAQHGASAMLVVNPPSQDHGDLKSVGSSGVGEPTSIPVMHVRSSLFSEMLQAAGVDPAVALRQWQQRADRGATRVEIIPGLTVRGEADLVRPLVTAENVAGFVPGWGDLAEEVVVVGAHYDHLGYGQVGSLAGEGQVHPGADDNASGTAGLVLLAERFWVRYAEEREARMGEGVEGAGRRTLLFVAFAGEELGLLGSTHLVKHLEELGVKQDQFVAMVNFDMIGRMEDKKLYVMGADTSPQWETLVSEAARQSGLDIDVQAHPFGGSDHAVFEHRGVPALHLFTGGHEDYHRPSDTAEKVNVQGLVAVVDFSEVVVERLVTQQRGMTFQPPQRRRGDMGDSVNPHGGPGGDSGGSGGGGGGGARLGIMPDYASLHGGGGCVISAVIPGSPAEHAGLRDDDVIIGWDDRPIRGLRGLMQALREGRPGQEVIITVQRGQEEVKMTVTLGSR